MGTQDYKIKVEYGVSAIVLLIGVFFIFQAFTIETSREAVGPRTMPKEDADQELSLIHI